MKDSLTKTLLGYALRLFGAGLVLFHGQLLWQRWADGSLADAGVIAQWLAAALLVVGLAVVHRRRGGLFSSREALVLWVLVILLHALTGTPASPVVAAPSSLLIVPFGLLVTALWLQLASRRQAFQALDARASTSRNPSPTPLPGHAGVSGSRPPPRPACR